MKTSTLSIYSVITLQGIIQSRSVIFLIIICSVEKNLRSGTKGLEMKPTHDPLTLPTVDGIKLCQESSWQNLSPYMWVTLGKDSQVDLRTFEEGGT